MGVDFVHIGAWWGRLILAYIAVKSGLFRVLAFIRPTTCGSLSTFFISWRRFWSIFAIRLNVMEIERCRAASRKSSVDLSLGDMIGDFGLVHRYRVDHVGQEI